MKPMGRKNYGSIPHLPSSRMGPADHHCHPGQEAICTAKARDRHDVIIVLEKVDGSNVGVARVGDAIVAVSRAGYPAQTSKYAQHQIFAAWVRDRETRFLDMLEPGQRLVGEWLAQAHGTRYRLPHGPFVAFDLMSGEHRAPHSTLRTLCVRHDIPMPALLHIGAPISVAKAMDLHAKSDLHGIYPEDGPEGVVYRVERKTEVDFLAKWVRPDKVDGKYLPGCAGNPDGAPEVWNWKP